MLFGCSIQQSVKEQETGNSSTSSHTPDRIMLSIPADPSKSRAVSWRTIYNDSVSLGEIAVVSPAPNLEDSARVVNGTFSPWETGSEAAMGHKVIFDNLNPETKYAYRIGNGEVWSEWFQFKTSSDKTEPFSFLYFGDVQNSIKSYCSRLMRQAYTHFPKADFMLFTGDLVSRSTEDYWREFFYAGNWIFGTMPSLATPGNHEYYPNEDGPRTFSKHWNQIFINPNNNPENLEGKTYFLDYQGVRFISLDSPAMGYREEDRDNTLDWLNKVLSDNPNKWTILFTHYPVYSCSQGRNNENYRTTVKPILEKYGVDLVLQGHDHTYCRGQNLSNLGDNATNMPMYVVSVAGPKMYGLNTSFWSNRMASNTQLYQNIFINGDTIDFKAYTVVGELYDDFKIIKNKSGQNIIIESNELATIKQRTEIPENSRKKYTEEEMNKYEAQFSNQ